MKYENHTAEFHNGTISVYNMDCMELLRQTPDKYYSLAIIDPPYGIFTNKKSCAMSWKKEGSRGTRSSKYNNQAKRWDIAPNANFFRELERVSKERIIWGANHFGMPFDNFVIWHKLTISEAFSMGMAELASVSIRGNSKVFHHMPQDTHRFHPTQKPVALYEWLLTKYAKKGDKILDTHGGSLSIAIACHNQGYDLTACELDKDYYDAAVLRIRQHQSQKRLVFAELEGEKS